MHGLSRQLVSKQRRIIVKNVLWGFRKSGPLIQVILRTGSTVVRNNKSPARTVCSFSIIIIPGEYSNYYHFWGFLSNVKPGLEQVYNCICFNALM